MGETIFFDAPKEPPYLMSGPLLAAPEFISLEDVRAWDAEICKKVKSYFRPSSSVEIEAEISVAKMNKKRRRAHRKLSMCYAWESKPGVRLRRLVHPDFVKTVRIGSN